MKSSEDRAADHGPGHQDQGGDGKERPHTPPAEWVVAGLSALLVLGMLGYTLRAGLADTELPPELTVRVDSVVPSPAGHLVMFTVRNGGGATAADVSVQGSLSRGDAPAETSEATLDYVPISASKAGGLIFSTAPSPDSLEIRVTGFEIP